MHISKNKCKKYYKKINKMKGGIMCHPQMNKIDIELIENYYKFKGNDNIGYSKIDTEGRKIITYLLNNNGNKILLGQGATGNVYKGIITNFINEKINQSLLVIKELKISPPQNKKDHDQQNILKISVCTELLTVIGLNHDNIVKYYGYADIPEDNKLILFLENIEGKELFNLINNENLSDNEKIDICNQLINGLDYLHLNGIYHRDIKLENIMIEIKQNPDGTRKFIVKYIDFNFGCKDQVSCLYTIYGQGTPIYISPEFAKNVINKIENKTLYRYHDLWALGCTLYTIISKKFLVQQQQQNTIQTIIVIANLTQNIIDDKIERNIPKTPEFTFIRENIINLLKVDFLDRKIVQQRSSVFDFLSTIGSYVPIIDKYGGNKKFDF